jgi:hypothetical protein
VSYLNLILVQFLSKNCLQGFTTRLLLRAIIANATAWPEDASPRILTFVINSFFFYFQLYVNQHVLMESVSNQVYVCALRDGLVQLVKQVYHCDSTDLIKTLYYRNELLYKLIGTVTIMLYRDGIESRKILIQ